MNVRNILSHKEYSFLPCRKRIFYVELSKTSRQQNRHGTHVKGAI